jgi:hypothetical protein
VRVALSDPFQMARTLRVHARLEGEVEFATTESEAMAEVLAPLPGSDTADRVEYWVEVLDPYGNQLVVAGSEFEPSVVGRVASAEPTPAPVPVAPTPSPASRSIVDEPLFWVGIAAGVIAVGAGIGIGVAVDSASHVPLRTGVGFGVQ